MISSDDPPAVIGRGSINRLNELPLERQEPHFRAGKGQLEGCGRQVLVFEDLP
jgi:hypothetical protein